MQGLGEMQLICQQPPGDLAYIHAPAGLRHPWAPDFFKRQLQEKRKTSWLNRSGCHRFRLRSGGYYRKWQLFNGIFFLEIRDLKKKRLGRDLNPGQKLRRLLGCPLPYRGARLTGHLCIRAGITAFARIARYGTRGNTGGRDSTCAEGFTVP